MKRSSSWNTATFERLYAADPDPWKFTSSLYEQRKYATTLAALPRRRFRKALEVGCSIGVFTRRLAPKCRMLLAIDVAQAALDATRRRCRGLPVTVARRRLPSQWPPGSFDLIVISEVLYFLNAIDLARTARRARVGLRPDGVIILVNWIGPTDTPHTGDEAAVRFIKASGLAPRQSRHHPGFRLDVLVHHPALSPL